MDYTTAQNVDAPSGAIPLTAALAHIRGEQLHPRHATDAEILTLIDALAVIVAHREWVLRAVSCPRCRAAAGALCRRPDAEPYVRRYRGRPTEPRYHCPRQDRMIRLLNRTSPRTWRLDVADGHALATLRAIRRSALYRLVRPPASRPSAPAPPPPPAARLLRINVWSPVRIEA